MNGKLEGTLNYTIIASRRNCGGLSPYGEPPGGSSAFSMMSRFLLGLRDKSRLYLTSTQCVGLLAKLKVVGVCWSFTSTGASTFVEGACKFTENKNIENKKKKN